MNRSLIKNAIFNILYKCLNAVFPLVSVAYISRILLPEGMGRVSYAQNITQYFVLLAPLGILNYGIKAIAITRDDRKKASVTFSELLSINFISTTVCVAVYYIVVNAVPYFEADRLLHNIAGLAIVFNYINVEWCLQGVEEYKYIAVRNFFVKLMSLLFLCCFVKSSDDYVICAIIYVAAIGGNNIFNFVRCCRSRIRFSLMDTHPVRHLKPLIFLFLNTIAIDLYTLFDTTMLGAMCDEKVVAYYTSAIKLPRMWISIITAICGILLPRISYCRQKGQEDECSKLVSTMATVLFYLIIPSMVGLFLLAEPVIFVLYGEAFEASVVTLKIAVILIFALGYSFLYGSQVLMAYNQEKKLLICSLTGAVSNLVLNYILIPMYAQNGAVVASVICELFVMLLTFVFASKHIKFVIKIKDILTVVGSSAVMGMVVAFFYDAIEGEITSLVICFLSGSITYFVLVGILNRNVRRRLKTCFAIERKKSNFR